MSVTDHAASFTDIARHLASAVELEKWVLAAQYVDILRYRHFGFIEAIDSLAAETTFASQHVDAQANVIEWKTDTRRVRWGQPAPSRAAVRGFHLAAIAGSAADGPSIDR